MEQSELCERTLWVGEIAGVEPQFGPDNRTLMSPRWPQYTMKVGVTATRVGSEVQVHILKRKHPSKIQEAVQGDIELEGKPRESSGAAE